MPGGIGNTANGFSSFAIGRQAKANHDGAFVWGDSTAADFVSTGTNQFLIRASGGVGIGTTSPAAQLEVAANTDHTLRLTHAGAATSTELNVGGDSAFSINQNGINRLLLKNGNFGIEVDPPNAKLDVNGDVRATTFLGSGSGLTGLSANNIASGTLPSAQLAGTYSNSVSFNNPGDTFAGNGSGLTALNASQLSSGTVPLSALGNAWKIGGDRKSTRLNSSHIQKSRMPSSA